MDVLAMTRKRPCGSCYQIHHNADAGRIIVIDQGEVLYRTSKKRFALAFCIGRESPTAEIYQRVESKEWAEIAMKLSER